MARAAAPHGGWWQAVSESAQATREQLAASLAQSPFQQLLGLRLEAFDREAQTVIIRCAYGPNVERGRGTGQYHGGVIASVIDIAGDYALMAVLGHGVPTINFRVDYLRAAFASDLLAHARVRKAGRTVGVVDIDVQDSEGRLIAVGRACYATQAG
ncbi:MAG TPA: PaaI family thioesterase [Steroidobacteraceae bacterium]|nr:PaaI family thioesterase [Steroidobacteraceae bacterium]